MLRRNKPYIMFKNFYIVCAICDNFLSHIVKIMHEAYYSYMVNLRFEKCSCHSVCNVYFWRFSIFSKNGSDFLTCSIAPKQSKNKFINCLLFIIIFYLCKCKYILGRFSILTKLFKYKMKHFCIQLQSWIIKIMREAHYSYFVEPMISKIYLPECSKWIFLSFFSIFEKRLWFFWQCSASPPPKSKLCYIFWGYLWLCFFFWLVNLNQLYDIFFDFLCLCIFHVLMYLFIFQNILFNVFFSDAKFSLKHKYY